MIKLRPFSSFGTEERNAVEDFVFDAYVTPRRHPLSGYLAGAERGGPHVRSLEDNWAATFHVKHAVACNSATSGLMAAAFAVGLKAGDQFVCPAMTMSATCAAPMFTGAAPTIMDVESEGFSLAFLPGARKAIFATNLFGHPAHLSNLRSYCDKHGGYLIEDNSQSPFAMEDGKLAGTIGHIGVFSLNIHKPLQCGEGGMIVTDDDELASRLRAFINHGEHVGDQIGLNLRMPEICAVIARVQLRRGPEIIAGRISQAEEIIKAIGHIPGIRPPGVRSGCTHVYYAIPFLIEHGRAKFCAALRDQGVPIVEGYVEPLYRMPAFAKFARSCPVAESLHDFDLFYFENCAWDVTPEEAQQIGDAFRKAAEMIL